MENKIVSFVKWIILIPLFLVENILKGISFVLLVITMFVLAIIRPLVKNIGSCEFTIGWHKYATDWRKGYLISRKAYKLWS